MYMSSFFNDLDDVIFHYRILIIIIFSKINLFILEEEKSTNIPLKEEEKTNKVELFESITKYTFYEYDDNWVRF